MKKIALISFAIIFVTVISCKQQSKVGESTTGIKDSATVDKVEVPAVDSVEGVTVDSSQTVNN